MPSADIAVPGRIEPTTTIGLSVRTTRFRKNEVSSSVSVPWVMTMPSTSGSLASAARACQAQQLLVGEALRGDLEHLLAAHVGHLASSGTPAISLSTGTLAAW